MGRPSKLSENQRIEIERRLLAGEKPADLAKEFKVSRTAISRGFSQNVQNVQNAAEQVAKANIALSALPISQQLNALNLAETLISISGHLASASRYGAMTAHRLAGIANSQVDRIDDSDPMKSEETLRTVGVLTSLANKSSEIGLNLLRANKEAVDSISKSETDADKPLNVMLYIPDNGR